MPYCLLLIFLLRSTECNKIIHTGVSEKNVISHLKINILKNPTTNGYGTARFSKEILTFFSNSPTDNFVRLCICRAHIKCDIVR